MSTGLGPAVHTGSSAASAGQERCVLRSSTMQATQAPPRAASPCPQWGVGDLGRVQGIEAGAGTAPGWPPTSPPGSAQAAGGTASGGPGDEPAAPTATCLRTCREVSGPRSDWSSAGGQAQRRGPLPPPPHCRTVGPPRSPRTRPHGPPGPQGTSTWGSSDRTRITHGASSPSVGNVQSQTCPLAGRPPHMDFE